MSAFGRDRWPVVSPCLDRALEMGNEERTAWLASLRAEGPLLAAELEALIEERARRLSASAAR